MPLNSSLLPLFLRLYAYMFSGIFALGRRTSVLGIVDGLATDPVCCGLNQLQLSGQRSRSGSVKQPDRRLVRIGTHRGAITGLCQGRDGLSAQGLGASSRSHESGLTHSLVNVAVKRGSRRGRPVAFLDRPRVGPARSSVLTSQDVLTRLKDCGTWQDCFVCRSTARFEPASCARKPLSGFSGRNRASSLTFSRRTLRRKSESAVQAD